MKKRIYYLDILRVIACLSVIMIHSSGPYVVEEVGTFNFWVGNILDGLARIGVPIFVMISGSLMLNQNYNFTKSKIIKHIKKMIIFFCFWSVIYCVVFNIVVPLLLKHEPISIIKILGSLIKGHYHLWFIYLIIGLYLIVPLLRLWVNDKNKKYVEYFIILAIIFSYLIPRIIDIGSNYSNIFEHLNEIVEKNLSLKYVGGYTAYFILGWYINNYDLKHKKLVYTLGIIGVFMTVIGTYILFATSGEYISAMYSGLSINVLFQSIAVFYIIKNRFINVTNDNNKIINSISKNSLGIYAIHVSIVTIMYYILGYIGINYAIVNIPIIFIISFLCAWICSYVLSKIPFLRKFV